MRWCASLNAMLDVCQCCSPARWQVCNLHSVLLLTPLLPACKCCYTDAVTQSQGCMQDAPRQARLVHMLNGKFA